MLKKAIMLSICSLLLTQCISDRDNDGIIDEQDNCADVPNGDQLDLDRNNVGDVCETLESNPIAYIQRLTGLNTTITRQFQSRFENETEFSAFHVTRQGETNTYHELSNEQVHEGARAHKAWMDGANEVVPGENTNHRGYPTIQFQYTDIGSLNNLVFVEFWVWLDVELYDETHKDWFSFATFSSYADDVWPRTQLLNLDKHGMLHLMHVPNQREMNQDISDNQAPHFPQREWVKLSILIDYTSENNYNSPYIAAWQNETLVGAARFNPRLTIESIAANNTLPCLAEWGGESVEEAEALCTLEYHGNLTQLHLGLYAPPLLTTGLIYNDKLTLLELSR